MVTARTPTPPRRILIVGSGGAGKSTLARALAPSLGLPLIHLDVHCPIVGPDA